MKLIHKDKINDDIYHVRYEWEGVTYSVTVSLQGLETSLLDTSDKPPRVETRRKNKALLDAILEKDKPKKAKGFKMETSEGIIIESDDKE